ncbi:MAG TPA: hypothetical protein VFT42_02670 [Solirubrobacteraceae bacterium]|nr:hypothetical protein [Solirubrobacteraceae bacterium]
MLVHAVSILAAEAHNITEHSKTAFYIVGVAFAAWAVVLAVLGLRRADFPGSEAGARAVMALSLVLAAGSMATAVITA